MTRFKLTKIYPGALLKILGFCLMMAAQSVAYANVKAALEGRDVIRLWPGDAPGTEAWSGAEFAGARSVTNVTVPTLTVFRPEPARDNGSAVVVCPGGGFTGLAIIEEGTMVAEWLAARGITAFLLKYRVRYSAFAGQADAPAERDNFDQRRIALEAGRKIAVADAVQAMSILRTMALDLKIDPDRIGMMGFSAGAMTTMSVVAEAENQHMPNFAASAYGAMPGITAPVNAPPLFIVHAADDAVVPASGSMQMYEAWTRAGLPVELHIFEKGGHGFGAVQRNQSADQWLGLFERWLVERGWIAKSSFDRP